MPLAVLIEPQPWMDDPNETCDTSLELSVEVLITSSHCLS